MKKLFFLLFLTVSCSFSQTKVKDTTTRKSTILYTKSGKTTAFKAENPPLIQILGAPPANYSHFWEFGDGTYSKESEPKKVYKKKGNYNVNLSVTNNYDNGKPPTARPKIIAINDDSNEETLEIASIEKEEGFKIFKNREPVPNEEIVVVVSYQNLLNYVANGKLYLFYNDKEFKNKNFELLETRAHFGEKEVLDGVANANEINNLYKNVASTNSFSVFYNFVPNDDENLEMTLLESKALFSDFKAFEFDKMNPNETRNMFFSFKTTPEMIKDTSATVRMRGIYVPDRNYKNHKKRTLEMDIVTSHDPNKMSSNGTSINYRLVRNKTINFKTRFQNNGEGPAKTIRLETDTSEIFDKKTLQIVDSYPKCPICPKGENVTYSCLDTIIKKDQIHFTFKNIYLPGSSQKNVTEIDSTKGFVKYSMKFAKDFHKIKTKSKTSIFFDKNEPVITNYAATKFKSGLSIGVKAGYNSFSQLNNYFNTQSGNVSNDVKSNGYFLGATISPYKSFRFYWQSEIYYSFLKASNINQIYGFQQVIINPPVDLGNGQIYADGNMKENKSSKITKQSIDIVPISLRYNINNYIGVGVGPQLSLLVNESNDATINKKYYGYNPALNTYPGIELTQIEENYSDKSNSDYFKKMQTSVFADITFGFVRIGPSIGLRYYLDFEKNMNYWQYYAIWKF